MKKKKRELRGVEQLGAVIGRVSDVAPPTNTSDARAPVSARDWEAAVGTRIAARAMPAKLDRGVLHVRVTSSTWAQELSLLGEPILAQLRARGIDVETLRFRVGRVEVPERSKTREDHVRTSPPAVKLPAPLARDLENVPNDELREVIRRAAEKNLGWQRMIGQSTASVETNVRRNEPVEISPKPDVRGPRSGLPGTDRPDRVAGPVSASPPRKRGLV